MLGAIASAPGRLYIRRILGLPETLRVLCMVSIGYPAEQKPPVPAERLAWENILPAP